LELMSLERALRTLWIVIGVLLFLVALGTVSFHFLEGLDFFDSLYLTVTVLSTVGFGDIVPKTVLGKVVYMGLVLTGVGVFGYAVSSIASLMAERSIFKLARGFFFLGGEGRLKNHVVVVGWNELSKAVCSELKANGCKVVLVVERDEEARDASKAGYDALVGSPLEEATYRHVRVEDAKAVVLTEDNPSKNLMAILRVREINRRARVVVACGDDLMKSLFYRAGADRVVNLADISGRILASFVFEPLVAEIIEDLSEAETGLDAEQVVFQAGRSITLRELKEKGLKSVVFAVARGSEKYYYPSDGFELKPGDVLILMGLREDLDHDIAILSRV